MLCPGSLAATEAIPKELRDQPSAAAEQGTRRHALLEWRLANLEEPWPTRVWGHKIVSQDVEAVSVILPYVLKHKAFSGAPGCEVWTERKVVVDHWVGLPEDTCWGTADLILITRDELEIADAKFGFQPVAADGNWQLRAYAVGAIAELLDPAAPGQFKAPYRQIRNLRLTILQPQAPTPVTSVLYPLGEVEKWIAELREGLPKALKPDAPRVAGEKQCKWCPAAATCREALNRGVKQMFEPVEPLAPVEHTDALMDLADLKMTEDPESLSVEEIGRYLDQALLFEGWVKSLRAYALKLAQTGTQVPGWKVVEGRRSRVWNVKDEEVLAFSLKEVGLAVKEIWTKSLITPAQAQKLEKVQTKPRVREKLDLLWSWKEGPPTLAPSSAEEPAMRSAETMFEEEPIKAPWET